MILRLFLRRRIAAARETRRKAEEALTRALWRRETRAIHEDRQRLKRAKHKLMRLEIGL